MAVDTRQKRMSMLDFGGPWPGNALPEADGTVDADDKYRYLHLYSGITLDPLVPSVVERRIFAVPKANRTFSVPKANRTFKVPKS